MPPQSVHEYTVYVQESNRWFKPVRRHLWAHDSDEAAQLFAEETEGRHKRFAIWSNSCSVFKTYELKPVQQFEVVPV